MVLAKDWTRTQKQTHINTGSTDLWQRSMRNTIEKSNLNERCWNIQELKKKSNLTLFIKTDSKWIIELNIKHKTIKLFGINDRRKPTWFWVAMTTYLCGSIGIYGGLFMGVYFWSLFHSSPMTTYNTKSTIQKEIMNWTSLK